MRNRINMKRRSLVILTLATAALLIVGTALAQGPGPRGPGKGSGHCDGEFGPGMGHGMGGEFGPGHRLEILAERLELTEEQIAAIKGIREAGQEKNLGLRKKLIRLNHDLQGELLKDEPSEKAALDLVGKIGALRTEMKSNRLKNRLEVRQLLTPEQRDKMLMLKERFKPGKGRHGGGHRGGPGGRGGCETPGCGKGSGGGRGNR
ncbi:MAG: Spy/CpxP family protein refolding chaperone [Candidatus Krumholzibacteriota bacterium]